ncbi:hypothetical protein LRS05_09485 [Flavobacterium sp. J372]|uniref:hypothetical protein n=1 Tax=Flavobacterium sp. J372 TaxID=2898436 RepID=UPI002151E2AD|nr:hypothetical protein [Flavobacterium sp. J372]MCR5862364.1 hypothetical protein [Flavobacterium sp. J372]
MRGSEWRKWDLHVHSPFSNLNNNYNCTIQDFANKILAENIAVIGLTNYFFISKQEIDDVKNALAGRCLVIPNIEFRINDKNKDNEFINYHVLFNPQIDITKVHQTLARLKLNNLRADNIYCTPENLATYGYASVTVSFDDLYKILHNDFKEGDDFVLVGPFKGYGGFCPDNKERNINLATKLDQKSSIIFSKKEDSDFFLNTVGKRHIYNLLAKPVIYCSDAHTINDIGKNFTWIKADITFEGFKQIIYEPEHRVRIQADKPDEKDARLIIDKIQFVTEDNRFTTKEIFLNENLNVIIGGKSSGKSILLYNIAKTLLPDRTDRSVLKYKNPDTNTYQYKYNFENFDFKVTLKSGAEQSVSRKDDESSILPEIKYIPQNYLSELAEKNIKKVMN